MHLIKQLFRINHIRNHYLRFGYNGVVLYYKLIFSKRKKEIQFNHKEYKYPIYLRNNSSDTPTFYQVLYNLDYEINVKSQPEIIIDLGANIGLSSVFFLNKYPNCKVVAVEAEESNYKMLLKNTKNYPNFCGYNKGIWNKNAYLNIKDNKLGNWGFSVYESTNCIEGSIEAISMDQLIEIHDIKQIDILKIDIEGSEIELFASNYERWLPMTKMIIIELHDWMREGCSMQFFSTLVKYNFELSHKGENLICYLKN